MLLPDEHGFQSSGQNTIMKSANPKGRNQRVKRKQQLNKKHADPWRHRSIFPASFPAEMQKGQVSVQDRRKWCTLETDRCEIRAAPEGKQGSLTLEAALTLPLFLMIITALLSFFPIMTMELKIRNAMNHAGKQLASYYYAVDSLQEDGEEAQTLLNEAGGSLAVFAVTETAVRDRIFRETGSIPDTVISGGSGGLSFIGSRFDEESQDVVICVSYRMVIPFLPSWITPVRISQQCRHRAWTGSNEDLSKQEQYVYVTENGAVYHTSLSCTYLKLSISQVSFSSVGARRNVDRGKYYPCEYCGSEGGDVVYITNYGDRYHFSRNCSRLKRGIRCVPISEAGGLPLCTRCKARGEK